MTAARLNKPEVAIDALLMDVQKNTYLVNGHNYQDKRLRLYLPGNGGLLAAISMMAAGWDGNTIENPGFPKNGQWNVKWEGLKKMP
jgi:protein-glucosylgalactosylhydroxylysine glucosidase